MNLFVLFLIAPGSAPQSRSTRPISRWAGLAVVGIVALLLSVAANPAVAVTPATLVTPDLDAMPIRVAGLRDGVLTYFDDERTLHSKPLDAFVQLRSIGDTSAPAVPSSPCIWLTDGQRFTGQWLGPTDDGMGVRWRHDVAGELAIPLDEIVSLQWQDVATLPADAPATDTLTLTNHDALAGFVSAMSEQGVSLIPDSADKPVTIPYARIARMTLANPVRAWADTGHRVILDDGSSLLAQELTLTDESAGWMIYPPGDSPRAVQVSTDRITRVDIGADGLRLIGLEGLDMRVPEQPSVFGLTLPVRMSGRSIRVHAPATVLIDLPRDASRFAATAELDTQDAPDGITDWADFQVVVSCEGQEVARVHITGSKPLETINTPVSGQSLTIRLEPGVNGPILDRLRLRNVTVLVRSPADESTGPTGR